MTPAWAVVIVVGLWAGCVKEVRVVGNNMPDGSPGSGIQNGADAAGGSDNTATTENDLDCAGAAMQRSNVGCSFHAAPFILQQEITGGCFAMFVVNPGSRAVKLTLERGTTTYSLAQVARLPRGSGRGLTYAPYDPAIGLGPGGVGIVFLHHNGQGSFYSGGKLTGTGGNCPEGIIPASQETVEVVPPERKIETPPQVHFGQTFHLSSDRPVVAYQIYPYGGAETAVTSATLLLPMESWGTSYVAAAPANSLPPNPTVTEADRKAFLNAHPQFLMIAASEDGTEVSLRTPASPDQRETIRLAAGQLVQFIAKGDEDLSGRPIISNKPIALFGGSPCFVRDSRIGCDSGHQQIPAVSALGHEYVAAPHGDRLSAFREAHTWKIVGAVAGTQLTYLPAAPPQAPQSLTIGQVVEFTSSEPFVVRSQDKEHPFYIAQYMSSCGAVATDGPNCQGDPEFVNVLPAAQFLSSYTFFADPTYSETHLVVVRARGQDNRFSDVRLGCAAAPIANWKPVGDYEVANVDLVTGDFVPVIPGCDSGRLVMTSATPFGITVWGWGSSLRGKTFVSYAYPAGTAARVVNNVIVE